MSVSTATYRDRLDALKAAMRAAGLEVLISPSDPVQYFFMGYNANAPFSVKAMVIRLEDPEPRLITRQMDAVSAWSTAWVAREQVEAYDDAVIAAGGGSAWTFIADRVATLAAGRPVGADLGSPAFSASAIAALDDALGKGKLADATRVWRAPRRSKSPTELQWMREASRIAESALCEGVAAIRPGALESDVAGAIVARQTAGLPGLPATPPIPIPLVLAAGPRLFEGHARWTTDPLPMRDHVNIELGAYRHRYCAALARTVSIGEPNAALRDCWDAVTASYAAALAAARTGAPCASVYQACKDVLDARGVTKYSRIGYAIGIDWGEGGLSLQAEDMTALARDETIHIVIGTWEHDVPVLFSETVRVTDDGGEALTDFSRDLIVRPVG